MRDEFYETIQSTEKIKTRVSEVSKVAVSDSGSDSRQLSIREELLKEVLTSSFTEPSVQNALAPSTQVVLNFSGREMSVPYVVKLADQDTARSLSIVRAVDSLVEEGSLSALVFSNQYANEEAVRYLVSICSKSMDRRRLDCGDSGIGLRHLDLQNYCGFETMLIDSLIDAGFAVKKNLSTLDLSLNSALLWSKDFAEKVATYIGQSTTIERVFLNQCAVLDHEIRSFAEALVSFAKAKINSDATGIESQSEPLSGSSAPVPLCELHLNDRRAETTFAGLLHTLRLLAEFDAHGSPLLPNLTDVSIKLPDRKPTAKPILARNLNHWGPPKSAIQGYSMSDIRALAEALRGNSDEATVQDLSHSHSDELERSLQFKPYFRRLWLTSDRKYYWSQQYLSDLFCENQYVLLYGCVVISVEDVRSEFPGFTPKTQGDRALKRRKLNENTASRKSQKQVDLLRDPDEEKKLCFKEGDNILK